MHFLGLNYCFNRLLDAKIYNLIAIICKYYVYQIFANVMNITFNCGNQKLGFC